MSKKVIKMNYQNELRKAFEMVGQKHVIGHLDKGETIYDKAKTHVMI